MQKAGKRLSTKIYYFVSDTKKEITEDITASPFFNSSLIGTVMRGLNLEIKELIPNTEIYFENTVSYGNDSATKTIGPYYFKENPTYNADTKTYSYELYDRFIKTMVPYEPLEIEFPTTVYNFFIALVTKCGFTTNIKTLPNGERIMLGDIYNGIDYTYRSVFEDIGQATATLFELEDNEIKKCILGTSPIKIDDDILKNQNISLGEHFGPINSIILSRSGESDSIYKRDESLTEWNEFKILDNQLMNDNNRVDYLQEIYDALYGIEYDIFDLELIGYGGFNPLDQIEISTGEKIYNSYVFNNEEKFTDGYQESIYTEKPEESVPNYSALDTTDRRINEAYIIVDKQNQTIDALVKQVDETTEKMTEVETTVDGIKESVTNTENSVKELSESIDLFSTDLDVYNLTIPCKGYIPLETKDFLINHYSYFKGKQVFVTPKLKEQIDGLTIETTENDIKVSTDNSIAIPSISNELVLTFEYSDESGKYTLQKKVIITLVQKGEDGAKGEDGKDGAQGLQGPPGENGQSTYLHVKYSVNETGSPMVDIPTEDTKYIGIATTTSETPPTAYTAYTWSLIKGADGKNGTNGTPGAPGADGRTPYLHIMYSEDGTTFTPEDEKYALGKKPSDYRGEYVDFDEQDSTNFEDYEWYYLNRNVDGKISDLQSQININDTNANNNYQDVLERLNNYADAESVNTLTQKVETMQSSTEYTIQVLENIQQNGVDRVTTENNFTFDKNGLNIDETGAPVSNTLDSYGMTIEDKHNNEDLLFAGFDTKTNETIVRSKNMTVEKYLSAPHVRIEEYNNPTFGVGTGYFYME